VGAVRNDADGVDSGRVYLFWGGPALADADLSMGGAADLVFTGEGGLTRFGFQVVGP